MTRIMEFPPRLNAGAPVWMRSSETMLQQLVLRIGELEGAAPAARRRQAPPTAAADHGIFFVYGENVEVAYLS